MFPVAKNQMQILHQVAIELSGKDKMKRRISLFSMVLTVCLLVVITGCKKSATASDSASQPNFEDGLNLYLQGHPQCRDFGIPWNGSNMGLPNEEEDELTGVGILSKSPYGVTAGVFMYSLTDTGKAALRKGSGELCYGTKKVAKIVNFTVPSETGAKESTVTYTWQLTNIPSWAQTLATKPYWSQQEFGKEVEGNIPEDKRIGEKLMVLTNLGWRVKSSGSNEATGDQ